MERAFASFCSAVTQQYGEEEAARAAEDWLDELRKHDVSAPPAWRSITALAAGRLARRVLAAAQG